MAGTKAGGQAAAATNKTKYGADFYAKIGAKGGKLGKTGGFFANFYVFSAAVKAHLIWLTIIGVLNSGIGAYYYLRIIVAMYMRESRKEVPVTPVPLPLGLALTACLAATIYLGIFPGRVLQYAQDSAKQLVRQSVPVPEPASSPPVSAAREPL